MNSPIRKIWNTVTNLEQTDNQTTAMCYSIINLMIKHRIVTREEAALQIEKSIAKVVATHRRIIEAMRERSENADRTAWGKALH